MENRNITLLQKSLAAATLRQEAISSNIANIHTANYKANQVVFESLLSEAANGVGLIKTQADHFGIGDPTDVEPIVSKKLNTTVKENGNNVDLDIEMVNLSQNTLHYQALIAQLNGQYSRIGKVISG